MGDNYTFGMSCIESVKLPVFKFGTPKYCTYCGDYANEQDHVIAVSYQHNNASVMGARTRTDRQGRSSGPTCYCCTECNRHLSNRWFDTFKERCEWAKQRLENKVKPILWRNSELEELDYKLRHMVETAIKRRQWQRMRADYYQSRDFFLGLESLVWEVGKLSSETMGGRFMRSYFSSIIYDASQALYRPRK